MDQTRRDTNRHTDTDRHTDRHTNRYPDRNPDRRPVSDQATGTSITLDIRTYRLINLEQFEEDFLQCPTCLETFHEREHHTPHTPKLLPCAHTFCLPCMLQVFENSPRDVTGVFSTTTIRKKIKCPSCRNEMFLTEQEINELPNDHRIIKLKDFLSKAPVASSSPNMASLISRTENVQSVSSRRENSRLHDNRAMSGGRNEQVQETGLRLEELRKFHQALDNTRRLENMQNRLTFHQQLESARRLEELQQRRTPEQMEKSIKILEDFRNREESAIQISDDTPSPR